MQIQKSYGCLHNYRMTLFCTRSIDDQRCKFKSFNREISSQVLTRVSHTHSMIEEKMNIEIISQIAGTPLTEFILTSVRPQMVDLGSEQGLSNFETAGIAGYVEDFKRAKTPLRAKRCRLRMGTNYLLL